MSRASVEISMLLFEPWQSELGVRALLQLLIVAPVCGLLGVWVMSYRLGYAAESLPHGVMPGIIAASVVGTAYIAGAAVAALLSGLAIAALASRAKVSRDSAIAVVITSAVTLGVALSYTGATAAPLQEVLFGNILGSKWSDVVTVAALSLAVLALLVVNHRRLTAVAFEDNSALGFSNSSTLITVMLALGLTVIVIAQLLGTLLAASILIAPAVAGLRAANSITRAAGLATALAALCAVGGYYLSYEFDLAVGPTIALTVIAIPGLLLLVKQGLLSTARS